jgi:uncharacterized membrane protein
LSDPRSDPSSREDGEIRRGERATGHAREHVQAALDASCAALLALESAAIEIRDAGPELEQSQEAELKAMQLVRSAIIELRRSVGSEAVSPLAYGFASERTRSEPATPDQPQTSSFRIA